MSKEDATRRSEPGRRLASGERPGRRVVMLGASNLAIHLPVVLETAKLLCNQPVDMMSALGHGRSYGMTSSVLGRVLPGILECGLWSDLGDRATADTSALVTDIGNDLLYGVRVDRVAAWVEECLARLSRMASTLVVTELPIASTHRLTEKRFLLLRSVFFPRCRLTFRETLTRTIELNARVQELAARYGAVVVRPAPDWYGFDPIHIRRALGAQVWREVLGHWSPGSNANIARPSLGQRLAVRRLRPLERRLWGRQQRQPQPAGRLSDGTTISLY